LIWDKILKAKERAIKALKEKDMAYDPDKELVCLRKLWDASGGSWITTKELDAIMEEVWGEEHGLACNSMMRRGLIDYHCDGDWSIEFTEEDLKEWESESNGV